MSTTSKFKNNEFVCRRLLRTKDKRKFHEILWDELIGIDGSIGKIEFSGVGQSNGDRLLIKWASKNDGDFFAIEVLDRVLGHLWEGSILPRTDHSVVCLRSICRLHTRIDLETEPNTIDSLDEIWKIVFSERTEDTNIDLKSEPHFIALVAAAISTSGVTSIKDDGAELANSKSEIHYYKELAKSQTKLLNERQQEISYRVEPKVEAINTLEEIEKKWKLTDLEEWAARNSERIIIMPRAISSAKRSSYENPALMYQCLELIADSYRRVKIGELDRNHFKNKCQELGLYFGGSVDKSNAGTVGDEYFVRWRGRRLFMDQHMGKGSARDPRMTLRIYYVWSDDDNKAIVGWLPSHLTTSRT